MTKLIMLQNRTEFSIDLKTPQIFLALYGSNRPINLHLASVLGNGIIYHFDRKPLTQHRDIKCG